MTLIEALKTGKEFRIKGDSLWWSPIDKDDYSATLYSAMPILWRELLVHDLLDGNWEVRNA